MIGVIQRQISESRARYGKVVNCSGSSGDSDCAGFQ